jgi:hypothetical protein
MLSNALSEAQAEPRAPSSAAAPKIIDRMAKRSFG